MSIIKSTRIQDLRSPALHFLETRLEEKASLEGKEIGAMDDDTANRYRKKMQLSTRQEFGYVCFLQFVRELTLTQGNRQRVADFIEWVNEGFDPPLLTENKEQEESEKTFMSYRRAATRLLIALQKDGKSTKEGDIAAMDQRMIAQYRAQAGNHTFEYDRFLQFDRENFLNENKGKAAYLERWIEELAPPHKTPPPNA